MIRVQPPNAPPLPPITRLDRFRRGILRGLSRQQSNRDATLTRSLPGVQTPMPPDTRPDRRGGGSLPGPPRQRGKGLAMHRILLAMLLAALLPAAPAAAQPAGSGTAAAAQAGPGEEVRAGNLVLSGAFARATPPRAPAGGAYLTIANHGPGDDRLVAVRTPGASAVQIHETAMADGVMAMRPLPGGLPVPAGRTVALRPGGVHLMLTGLSGPLAEGQVLHMVLRFETAGEVTVAFPVRPLTARLPEGAPVRASP